MGWALRNTKKGGKYNAVARQLVVDLFEAGYKNHQKIRATDVDTKMRARTDILPVDRMSIDQIKNLIRSLVAAKKKEVEANAPQSRRRKRDIAFLDDMEQEFVEEELVEQSEVGVEELMLMLIKADKLIEADAIYDMIHSEMAYYFDEPEKNVGSEPIGDLDE